jgi:hypothetical protein
MIYESISIIFFFNWKLKIFKIIVSKKKYLSSILPYVFNFAMQIISKMLEKSPRPSIINLLHITTDVKVTHHVQFLDT